MRLGLLRNFYIFTSFFGFFASSAPVANRNISKAFDLQDKICSVKFNPKDGSYWRAFEQMTGFILPPALNRQDITPYTGFKFLRTYSFKPTSLSSQTNLMMVFCSEGKVQWDLSVPVKQDIDWRKPICVYNGPKKVEAARKKSFWTKILGGSNSFGSKKKSEKEKALADLDNLHCFKLARRKKYFNRSMSLFFPGSWVGGMYFCDLTDDSKKELVDQMDDNLSLQDTGKFDYCTSENAVPLMPIGSDNYGKSWREYESSKLLSFLGRIQDFRVTKFVPFLYTPNYPLQGLNIKGDNAPYPAMTTYTDKILREQSLDVLHRTSTVRNAHDPWFTDIEVQENYSFSAKDERRLDRLTSMTKEALGGISTSALNSARRFLSNSDSDQARSRADRRARKLFNRLEAKFWDHLSLYDKELALIGSNDEYLQQLDEEWKNLHLEESN